MTEKNTIHKEPNWIFFDLDDTLWDFSYNSRLSLEYMYRSRGEITDKFADVDAFIDRYHDINARLWDEFSRGEVSSDELRIRRWHETLFPGFTEDTYKNLCMDIDTEYLRKLAEFPNLFEGTTELMEKLTKSFLIGILSNGFKETQYAKAMNSGLWKYITRLLVSSEIGKNKPHKDFFQFAIDETGAHSPYLLVGDHYETDVLGALKAGWHAIWFNPSKKDETNLKKDIKKEEINPSLYLGTAFSLKEVGDIIENFYSSK